LYCQAKDGILDDLVTGVQTCALPIYQRATPQNLVGLREAMSASDSFPLGQPGFVNNILDRAAHLRTKDDKLMALEGDSRSRAYEIGRASCRVGVVVSVCGGVLCRGEV